MERIGDAFVWPFRDPDWPAKIAIMGLIQLIPIAGPINGLGWMLSALDGLRSAEQRLPPANFSYLGRGFQLFAVYLVYVIGLLAIAAVVYVPAVLIFIQQGRDATNGFLVAVAGGLALLTISVVTLGGLAITFATPAIVLAVDGGGIAAGLRVGEVVRRARFSVIDTLIAGLMLIAAGLVGQLGSVACLVGVAFTSAYALAMQAWIVRSFEVGSTAAST